MTPEATRDVVRAYYEAWARQDREGVRALLADDVSFRSPQDRFETADAFLEACWAHAEGLSGVTFERELYDGEQAFVLLGWQFGGGEGFVDAEYVRVRSGRVVEVLVVNNDPSFGGFAL